MPAPTDALRALEAIRASGFRTGNDWARAHEIAQDHEGEPLFDAIHALVHRIEGDAGNAAYWDRRAGTDLGGEGVETELARLEKMARK